MVNIVKDDKISKKKKTVKPIKKVSDKKAKTKSGYTVRNTSLAIPKINDIRVIKRTKKKSSIKKIIGKIFMLLFVVSLSFSSVYAYNHLMSYLSSLERFFNSGLLSFKSFSTCHKFIPMEVSPTLKGIKFIISDGVTFLHPVTSISSIKNLSRELK